jgi:hypothetical protein
MAPPNWSVNRTSGQLISSVYRLAHGRLPPKLAGLRKSTNPAHVIAIGPNAFIPFALSIVFGTLKLCNTVLQPANAQNELANRDVFNQQEVWVKSAQGGHDLICVRLFHYFTIAS